LDRSGTGARHHSGRSAASQDILMISGPRMGDLLIVAATIAAVATLIGLLMLFVIYGL
jgi:hypothetical protein